jgi:tRNA G18 (ribose-2'-O)-methylase SpoU
VYALEEDTRAVSIDLPSTTNPHPSASSGSRGSSAQRGVVVVGNEVTGVDPELLDLCDQILYIPMRGEKKSFNVAIAFGIAAYALRVKTMSGSLKESRSTNRFTSG